MFFKVNTRLIALLAGLAILGGCTQVQKNADDPKNRLTGYISKSFELKDVKDRDVLAGFLTGDAKTRMQAWSDDQFREAFLESKRKYEHLLIREAKEASPTEFNITYELTYVDQAKGKDAKVTSKKLARMIKENGTWFISEVRNIKELVEYQNEMSLP